MKVSTDWNVQSQAKVIAKGKCLQTNKTPRCTTEAERHGKGMPLHRGWGLPAPAYRGSRRVREVLKGCFIPGSLTRLRKWRGNLFAFPSWVIYLLCYASTSKKGDGVNAIDENCQCIGFYCTAELCRLNCVSQFLWHQRRRLWQLF